MVEVWHGRLYCMVNYNPVVDCMGRSRRGMMRPEIWHSTVFRAFFSYGTPEEQDIMANQLRERMWQIWDAVPIPQQLTVNRHSIWTKSWNFEVDKTWASVLQLLRSSFGLLLKNLDRDARILDHWEFHVSWH